MKVVLNADVGKKNHWAFFLKSRWKVFYLLYADT